MKLSKILLSFTASLILISSAQAEDIFTSDEFETIQIDLSQKNSGWWLKTPDLLTGGIYNSQAILKTECSIYIPSKKPSFIFKNADHKPETDLIFTTEDKDIIPLIITPNQEEYCGKPDDHYVLEEPGYYKIWLGTPTKTETFKSTIKIHNLDYDEFSQIIETNKDTSIPLKNIPDIEKALELQKQQQNQTLH